MKQHNTERVIVVNITPAKHHYVSMLTLASTFSTLNTIVAVLAQHLSIIITALSQLTAKQLGSR